MTWRSNAKYLAKGLSHDCVAASDGIHLTCFAHQGFGDGGGIRSASCRSGGFTPTATAVAAVFAARKWADFNLSQRIDSTREGAAGFGILYCRHRRKHKLRYQ